MPDRRKQRYGDADFDWDFRVDTTSATVGWRTRLLGLLHSPYQPVEPELFEEIMNVLNIDFARFTFVDIGSGKGRALLLASRYAFDHLIGIELLPELHRVAGENVAKRFSGGAPNIALICADAAEFIFPQDPLVVFLFHPLPEAGFRRVMNNLEKSLCARRRSLYLIYANPIFESLVRDCPQLRKIRGTHQYAVFSNSP